jgi:hypothetical protein
MFPKVDRFNASSSAADYAAFVGEMYGDYHHQSARFRLTLPIVRQRDLAKLGPVISFEQFSVKMWDIITGNRFYDHLHWTPGPLGCRDPMFQTLMHALWTMVCSLRCTSTFCIVAFHNFGVFNQ